MNSFKRKSSEILIGIDLQINLRKTHLLTLLLSLSINLGYHQIYLGVFKHSAMFYSFQFINLAFFCCCFAFYNRSLISFEYTFKYSIDQRPIFIFTKLVIRTPLLDFFPYCFLLPTSSYIKFLYTQGSAAELSILIHQSMFPCQSHILVTIFSLYALISGGTSHPF